MKRKFRFIMVGARLTLPGSATFSIAQTINNTSVERRSVWKHLLDGRAFNTPIKTDEIKFEFSTAILNTSGLLAPAKVTLKSTYPINPERSARTLTS